MATRCLVPRRQALFCPRLPSHDRGYDLGGDPAGPLDGLRTAGKGELDRGQVAPALPPSRPLSVAGNKKDDLTIIYTPADNLKVGPINGMRS